MRLSISNIAWDLPHEPAIAAWLAQRGIDLVDIAPGKYFADPEHASEAEIAAVRALWRDRGFAIHGMQSLLFGTSGLNLFADHDHRLERRLAALVRIASGLGVKALTFGSPRQRDRSGIGDDRVLEACRAIFRRLGDVAARHDTLLCLEANPAAAGCNFMTTTGEAAAIVAAIDHPAIRLQLDIGTIAANAEPLAAVLAEHAPLFGHVHASEPGLAPLGMHDVPHGIVAAHLRRLRPDLVVTIEMVADARACPLDAVARAVALARRSYGQAA